MKSTPLDVRTPDGVRLVADAWGDPAHPPVVLLHGGGQTRHAWQGTGRVLADAGFRSIAVDFRGHGESDWDPRGAYPVDAFVTDVRAVLSDLERPPALVGASLGGVASLLAAGESRERICWALVLVDIAPRIEREGADRIRGFMTAHPDGFGSLEEASQAIAAYLPHRPARANVSGLAKNLRLGQDGRFRWHWDPRFLEGGPRPRIMEERWRLEAAARALDVPTLLVRGRWSDILTEEGAKEFLTLVPDAEYEDVADAAHMVAGDRNDAFTDAAVDFLRRHRPGGGQDPGASRRSSSTG